MEVSSRERTDDFIESLINLYESRIKGIEIISDRSEAIIVSSFDLFRDFSSALKEYRAERQRLNSHLKERLAKNGSLRKKDYDQMMSVILSRLDEKECESENALYQFIQNQKLMTQFLKKGIFQIKGNMRSQSTESIQVFRQKLNSISIELESKKETAFRLFREYQHIHFELTSTLKTLLTKRDEVLAGDVKAIKKDLLKRMV